MTCFAWWTAYWIDGQREPYCADDDWCRRIAMLAEREGTA
jgi:hypothetical protein